MHAHAHQHRVLSYFTLGLELNCSVAVAADWISRCGRILFGGNEEVVGGEGGPMWEGKAGLCPERWQFWKQRFGKISDDGGIDE